MHQTHTAVKRVRKEGRFSEVIQWDRNPTQRLWTIGIGLQPSVHLSDKLVDVRLPVTKVAALNIVLKLARSPTASGIRKFERPEEVRRLTNEANQHVYTIYNVVTS